MSNKMYNSIKYIYWSKEAHRETISQKEMIMLIEEFSRARTAVSSKTKRSDFTEDTYKLDKHGDYYEMYYYHDGKYYIKSTNGSDNKKNGATAKKADRLFDLKFRELNGLSVRKAFGFVGKGLKRCIPKQFYYLNKGFIDVPFLGSSIDASSQYPAGCLGNLPDSHTAIKYKGRAEPTEEYPFAFYKSGHVAEYGKFDTHRWIGSPYMDCLFRFDNDEYAFQPLKDDEEITILMKASSYKMDSTWQYFYDIKQSKAGDEYEEAKLIMNKTIGCWHRKDKDKKRCMTYEDHGSYQFAHIVAVAIARGNQKILDMVQEINRMRIAHICVDGIIYAGEDKRGSNVKKMGCFAQEFTGATVVIKDMNVYAAEKNGEPVKFKHGSYDLIYDKPIEDRLYGINDLEHLSRTVRLGDIVNG